MPGVPSGRGCEACRKAKKKCGQELPSCLRCTRRGLQCNGNGERRYKFIQEEILPKRKKEPSPDKAVIFLAKPVPALGDEVASLASAFVSTLSITDPRYSVMCYGVFLPDIPARMGKHPALDASIAALTHAYPVVHTSQPTQLALSKYGSALTALRVALEDDDVKKSMLEILCAIYFLMVTQIWLSRPGERTLSHGEAIASVLDTVAGTFDISKLGDGFAHQLLAALCLVVLMESVFNPNCNLHPWYYTNIVALSGPASPKNLDTHASKKGGLTHDSLCLWTLAQIPLYVRRPSGYLIKINTAYWNALVDLQELSTRKALFLTYIASLPSPSASPLGSVLPLLQIAHGMLLAVTLIYNILLSLHSPTSSTVPTHTNLPYGPSPSSSTLPSQLELDHSATHLISEVLILAHTVSRYRPLGAAYMPIALVAAYIVCPASPSNASEQDMLMGMLREWETDFGCAKWVGVAERCRGKFWEMRTRGEGWGMMMQGVGQEGWSEVADGEVGLSSAEERLGGCKGDVGCAVQ
ncbi:hypothetical protein B0A48_08991 [Cryoendolithus antarcticus]|uniref:Zn(2)-C6 fungal-type domain-containing protein n=1 Tax=Cryoendolithus antarcticus TaxID=1507870 RepID=A0A1V8T1N7_9PEZI|nr:hypothetical protein B0A48_08991 [Cryoendolithus antarcticus]